MNPRYMAYCRANGKTPVEMMAADAEAFPGAAMCGYILWVNERWREWDAGNGRTHGQPRTLQDQYDFDVWLAKRVPETTTQGDTR